MLLAVVQIAALVTLDLFFTWLYWGMGATADAPKWSIQSGFGHLEIMPYVLISVSIATLFFLLRLTLFKDRQSVSSGYIFLFSFISSVTFFAMLLTRLTDSRFVLIVVMFVVALLITEVVTVAINKVKKTK